ncbi:unnamed protein product [Pieris macdunnoughi]|uniref:Uncharacterized protein n=1 Tax=Pieris macdunnoughi TaxID=345717 RepID=A0A821WY00_9NEOP|nr:unnamed protein product [Pieris macdunnoughi]
MALYQKFISGPARRRDADVDVDQGNDDTWPHPDTINKFPVPDAFVNVVTEATEENEDAQASRGGPRHHRFHRH